MHQVSVQKVASAGLITLTRPAALNALSLEMIRALTGALLQWQQDPHIRLVAMRGSSKNQSDASSPFAFGAFCAGGDIRFFHRAALAGDPLLEDFFTEEYRLNYLIHNYGKPVVAFMDGVVMGGGMGLAQGAGLRLVTERTKMAMPETGIGLFPDVGGGYFLSRCAGHIGEYLGLTGCVLNGTQAVAAGLADVFLPSPLLAPLWAEIAKGSLVDEVGVARWIRAASATDIEAGAWPTAAVDQFFCLGSAGEIIHALEAAAVSDPWARDTAAVLRRRSPLMLQVTLEQIRRARGMDLASELRMERDMVRHCFRPTHLERVGTALEVVEGVRALVVDKDHQPRWNPGRIEDVQTAMVAPFFASPWPEHAHPLRGLDG